MEGCLMWPREVYIDSEARPREKKGMKDRFDSFLQKHGEEIVGKVLDSSHHGRRKATSGREEGEK